MGSKSDYFMKKVSLIIPVHNSLKVIKSCLKSVIKNFDFNIGEVLIIDDYSDNATEKYLTKITKRYNNKLKLYRNTTNLGYLQSCNIAVKKVNSEIIIILNSDCEIPKKFTTKIIKCFEYDSNIIAASPIASASANYFINPILPCNIINKLLDKRKAIYPDIYNSEGFCFCVRGSYIDKYGLFDTVYNKGYCEEVDFCFGVQKQNKRTVLIDNLYVIHKRHRSFNKDHLKFISQNNKILYSKWGELINEKEINQLKQPIIDIIYETFGIMAPLFIFVRKLQGLFRNNRIFTLKNIFKFYDNRKKYNKVVYTCISGIYDILPPIQKYVDTDWKYICFTDNKTLLRFKKLGIWNIKPLYFNKLDNTRNARWHKTHPHILFPEYGESLWIDANINILTPYIFDKIKKENKNILVPKHYCRTSIYQEFEAVKYSNKEDDKVISDTFDYIKSHNMPDNYGMNETNIIYRKHNNNKIKKLTENWWYMIENYSKRDQLSFSYVLFKNNITVNEISIDNARIDCFNFKIYSHNTQNTLTGKLLSNILK